MYELSGKVAIVTGAGGRRGIGRAMATRLAREGADVVVTDIMRPLRPEDEAEGWKGIDSVVAEIEAMGRRALGLYSDVTDAGQVSEMVERTVNTLGKIDIFCANAGSQPGGDRKLLIDVEEDDFDLVQRVNVKGTFLCLKAVCRHMVDRGGPGKIVITSSRAGEAGHRAIRDLLRFQVRAYRYHAVSGPGDGAVQRQRQRHLSRSGRHGARQLHRRCSATGGHERGGLPPGNAG